MEFTALIMAGGRGERFWPKSRKQLPKQFLSLTNDGKTMIQLTVERILPIVKIENIYIATNEAYRSLVKEQLPGILPENILCEPAGRNTAPCIGLGAVHIEKKHKDAVMIVLPSDHLIQNTDGFVDTLNSAGRIACSSANLVTIGITPSYPETGYGYIQMNRERRQGPGFLVQRFVEKPDLELAKKYLESGEYLWNSGMFVWKVSTFLYNMKELMPETYAGLQKIAQAVNTSKETEILKTEFPRLPSQSVDYGIMEKARQIFVLPGDFGWDDVGSWLAVERIHQPDEKGNVITGNFVTVDTEGCILQGNKKLIATVGLQDIIVVDTEDATLICAKESAGDIKKILEQLKQSPDCPYL